MELGGCSREESAVSSGKDWGVKHDLLKSFQRRYKQRVFLFSLCVSVRNC